MKNTKRIVCLSSILLLAVAFGGSWGCKGGGGTQQGLEKAACAKVDESCSESVTCCEGFTCDAATSKCISAGGAGEGAPTVVSTSPEKDAIGVALDTKVSATFSVEMDANTFTTDSFIVKDSSNKTIAGTVSYSDKTATFTPASNLSLMTIYTATITTGVKDTSGNSMAAEYTWTFTSRDGKWGSQPVIIGGGGYNPQIAMNENGSAMVVWQKATNKPLGYISDIWSNRYIPGTNWGSPVPVYEHVSVNSWFPQVGTDKNGNAIVVWQRFNDPNTSADIYSRIYKADTKLWDPIRRLENFIPNEQSWYPKISVNSNGDAIVVWWRFTTGGRSVFAD